MEINKTVYYNNVAYFIRITELSDGIGLVGHIDINNGEYQRYGALERYGDSLQEIVTNVIKEMNYQCGSKRINRDIENFKAWDGIVRY